MDSRGAAEEASEMISTVDEHESFALLSAATVGRIGFIHDGRIEIIPVNYLMDGRDIVIRTAEDGILSDLPEQPAVAFEVDHHEDLSGTAWSVLLSGAVQVIPADVAEQLPGIERVKPWAGGDRTLWLRFVAEHVAGRRVRRRRNV